MISKLISPQTRDHDTNKPSVEGMDTVPASPPLSNEDSVSFVQTFFRDKYGPVLLRPAGKIAAFVLFLVYLSTAAWGCSQMQSGLQPEKLVYQEHYATRYLQSMYYWDDGQQISVTVEKPPNMTLSSGRQKMLELASAFEDSPYSFGSDATIFWLREYLLYLNTSTTPMEDTQKQWCEDLKNWIRGDTVGIWKLSVRWGNESEGEDECQMKAFRFSIAAKQASRSATQVKVVTFFRDVCSAYSEYKVSTYNGEFYAITDQYLVINSITIRNSIIAFFVMIVISVVLIPNPVCGLFITLSTVFIDVGVCGYLAWWGVNMDCVSMITMIMATGIAIDLSAHVSYAFVRAEGTPHARAIRALESLGWPVFQGVTAMFLGVLVLSTPDSYMYKTFFKTVFLVIIFGLMHSIIFLPVALSVFAPRRFIDCCKARKSGSNRARVAASVNGVAAPSGFSQIERKLPS